MNSKKKSIFGLGLFFLCVGIGFMATKFYKVLPSRDNDTNMVKTDISTNPKAMSETEVQKMPTALKISKTEVRRDGNSYSLQILCENIPTDMVLSYEIPELNKKSADGYFARIPATPSEVYLVRITNSKTGEILVTEKISGFKILEKKPIEFMSAREFQTILLNHNDYSILGGKNPKVARTISLSFEGLRNEDKRPGDILTIREKIAFGIWNSAKVLKVGYDNNGKINSATIQPIYKNQEE